MGFVGVLIVSLAGRGEQGCSWCSASRWRFPPCSAPCSGCSVARKIHARHFYLSLRLLCCRVYAVVGQMRRRTNRPADRLGRLA